MSPKSGSMRYAHICCGWSKSLKPNESRRAFIRSAWVCFAASTSPSHAPRALLDEAIDRSASGSEILVVVIGGLPHAEYGARGPPPAHLLSCNDFGSRSGRVHEQGHD